MVYSLWGVYIYYKKDLERWSPRGRVRAGVRACVRDARVCACAGAPITSRFDAPRRRDALDAMRRRAAAQATGPPVNLSRAPVERRALVPLNHGDAILT